MPGAQLEDEALRLARRIAGLFRPTRGSRPSRCAGRAPRARRSIPAPTSTCMSIPRRVITRSTSAGPSSSAWAGVPGQPGADLWANGDVWIDARSGIEVDAGLPRHGLDRAGARSPAAPLPAHSGVHHLRLAHRPHGVDLFDRSGWFARLQAWSDQSLPARAAPGYHQQPPYSTRDRSSYRDNLEKSLARRDLVFINNEVTWLLVAYFDILFALNNVPHPGAKRLLEQVERLCPRRPPDLPAPVRRAPAPGRRRRCPPPARARPPGR